MSVDEKRALIIRNHPHLSLRRQCALLGFHRSNVYYQPQGECAENVFLMKLLDEEYTRHPFYGVRKMQQVLRDQGYLVNHKRIRRLLRIMGLEAIAPKKNLSQNPISYSKKYPYLLKGLDIERPNQVWCADITYLRLWKGFVYLVAIMDWYSRYVLSFRVSNSLDASFCIESLDDALRTYGVPEIFNSDQGVQFTSEAWTELLCAHGIQISMDARGRAFDNIFIERLWRSVKYEEVYLHDYESITEAKDRLRAYFQFYNFERHHQGLQYQKPAEWYWGTALSGKKDLLQAPRVHSTLDRIS